MDCTHNILIDLEKRYEVCNLDLECSSSERDETVDYIVHGYLEELDVNHDFVGVQHRGCCTNLYKRRHSKYPS